MENLSIHCSKNTHDGLLIKRPADTAAVPRNKAFRLSNLFRLLEEQSWMLQGSLDDATTCRPGLPRPVVGDLIDAIWVTMFDLTLQLRRVIMSANIRKKLVVTLFCGGSYANAPKPYIDSSWSLQKFMRWGHSMQTTQPSSIRILLLLLNQVGKSCLNKSNIHGPTCKLEVFQNNRGYASREERLQRLKRAMSEEQHYEKAIVKTFWEDRRTYIMLAALVAACAWGYRSNTTHYAWIQNLS
jgi:hypothetical protein